MMVRYLGIVDEEIFMDFISVVVLLEYICKYIFIRISSEDGILFCRLFICNIIRKNVFCMVIL